MPPAPPRSRRSDAALVTVLLLGNLVFLACVAGQCGPVAGTERPRPVPTATRILLPGD